MYDEYFYIKKWKINSEFTDNSNLKTTSIFKYFDNQLIVLNTDNFLNIFVMNTKSYYNFNLKNI